MRWDCMCEDADLSVASECACTVVCCACHSVVYVHVLCANLECLQ